MSGISLTASMRSNLLSLQNIAGQQNIVQNRLATGLKVSSAIDNPSSYYTASSLNNRAADLTVLLDSMSQGIQTIKAASEAIDSGTKFLEQAKAAANQALEKPTNIAAKVSTEKELLAAIDSGKEGLIVIENDIDMSSQDIVLADRQSLVGKSYFSPTEPAVKIKAQNIYAGADSTFANLALDITFLYITDKQNVNLANLDFNIRSISAINSQINVSGQINAAATESLFLLNAASVTFLNGAALNSDSAGRTIVLNNNSAGIINQNVVINARTYGNGMETFSVSNNSRLDISGTINAYGANAGFAWLTNSGNNQINILKTARIYVELAKDETSVFPSNPGQKIFFEAGAQIGLKKPASTNYIQCTNNYTRETGSIKDLQSLLALPGNFTADTGGYVYDFTGFTDFVNDLIANRSASQNTDDEKKELYDSSSFNRIISQYDRLISDASYKGVNLLSGQNLKINFNEDRSSKIDVTGVKADSNSLGIKTKEWYGGKDIEKSISELEDAINLMRGYASEFGNYYSIVTTRQDFTENLINVLEEGADKLTLADMNQEAANMLALQTAQQLAVNSLSLASQTSQTILKLF